MIIHSRVSSIKLAKLPQVYESGVSSHICGASLRIHHWEYTNTIHGANEIRNNDISSNFAVQRGVHVARTNVGKNFTVILHVGHCHNGIGSQYATNGGDIAA